MATRKKERRSRFDIKKTRPAVVIKRLDKRKVLDSVSTSYTVESGLNSPSLWFFFYSTKSGFPSKVKHCIFILDSSNQFSFHLQARKIWDSTVLTFAKIYDYIITCIMVGFFAFFYEIMPNTIFYILRQGVFFRAPCITDWLITFSSRYLC